MRKGSVITNIHKVKGDICYIYTQKRNKEISGVVLIDREDMDRVLKRRWSINARGYVTNCLNKKTIRLHTFVGGRKSLDHINRNQLDNRKSNLRVVTVSDNQHNRGMFRNNKSGVKGVMRLNSNIKKWRSQIRIRNKFYCKSFKTKKEAIEYRRNLEKTI